MSASTTLVDFRLATMTDAQLSAVTYLAGDSELTHHPRRRPAVEAVVYRAITRGPGRRRVIGITFLQGRMTGKPVARRSSRVPETVRARATRGPR